MFESETIQAIKTFKRFEKNMRLYFHISDVLVENVSSLFILIMSHYYIFHEGAQDILLIISMSANGI